MKQNLGTGDRVVRLLVGAVALALAGFAGWGTAWGVVLSVVAAIGLVSGLTGWALPYALFGISTVRHRHRH